MVEFCFWLSLSILYYVYDGYCRFLTAINYCFFLEYSAAPDGLEMVKVTVLITVFNEADVIEKKIQNVLNCDYPSEMLEVIVASDSSTDATDDIVAHMNIANVKLFRPAKSYGKTDTQNQAIMLAKGQIIIFTDADTRFDKMFLRNIVVPFSKPMVGGVSGHLLFHKVEESGVSKSQSYYWETELRTRQMESSLGILAVGTGACLAIRKCLFQPMEAEFGEDCVIPLDIVLQGYKMVHATNAIAFDQMPYDSRREFGARVRMTLRNVQGTMSRRALLNPFVNFRYAFSLWSHKLMRWFSPVFLIILTICSLVLMGENWFYHFFALLLLIFYMTALLGWLAERNNWAIPVVKTIYSFILANCGFLVGLIRAVLKERITAYGDNTKPRQRHF